MSYPKRCTQTLWEILILKKCPDRTLNINLSVHFSEGTDLLLFISLLHLTTVLHDVPWRCVTCTCQQINKTSMTHYNSSIARFTKATARPHKLNWAKRANAFLSTWSTNAVFPHLAHLAMVRLAVSWCPARLEITPMEATPLWWSQQLIHAWTLLWSP